MIARVPEEVFDQYIEEGRQSESHELTTSATLTVPRTISHHNRQTDPILTMRRVKRGMLEYHPRPGGRSWSFRAGHFMAQSETSPENHGIRAHGAMDEFDGKRRSR